MRALELIQNSGEIKMGNAYLGIGICLDDVSDVEAKCAELGGDVLTPVSDFAYGASILPDEDDLKQIPARYGVLADPDGYKVEVTENLMPVGSHFAKVVLNVISLDESVDFYSCRLNMKELRRRSNVNSIPKQASMISRVSHASSEQSEPFLELVYKYATNSLDVGSGLYCLAVSAEKALLPPQVNGGMLEDPNGYSIQAV